MDINKMKTLKEAAGIVGVTRRSLQGYDKIGLLHPSMRADNGYCFYDDHAIEKLMIIKVFVDGGYPRKQIKELFESPTTNWVKEFERLMISLEEKKKQIDGTINTIKLIQSRFDPSMAALTDLLQNIQIENMYQNRSFADSMKDSIQQSEEYNEATIEAAKKLQVLSYAILCIGSLNNLSVYAPDVVRWIEIFIDSIAQTMKDMQEEVLSRDEMIIKLEDTMKDALDDEEFRRMIEMHCGTDAPEFIIKAARAYSETWQRNNR